MKRNINVILIILLLLFPLISFGQNEEVSTGTSVENMEDGSFTKLLSTYNKVVRTQEEKTSLLKIDLLGPSLYIMSLGGSENDSVKNNLIRVSFEKKIKPEMSWIAGFTAQTDQRGFRDIGLHGGMRYYYNMNKRILKGKSANNFSANYIGAHTVLRTKTGKDENLAALYATYGLQRRIGKFGYADFNIGLGPVITNYEALDSGIDFTMNLEIGLGF